MEERYCLLALQMLLSDQPRRIRKVMDSMPHINNMWNASSADWQEILGVKQNYAEDIIRRLNEIDPLEEEKHLKTIQGDFISFTDDDYPENLKNIVDPPAALYIIGDKSILKNKNSLAIVGSRKGTVSGCRTASDMASTLTGKGVTIISGLANGIDTAVHQGALLSGPTIAVQGCGIDRCYPSANQQLKEKITADGAVISEFPIGSPPLSWHFPQRNRLISALSLGTLVVEADMKSGAMITAKLAAEQGKEVFAVPGSINNYLSRGPHQLIREGAWLTESADDVINVLFGELCWTEDWHINTEFVRNKENADIDGIKEMLTDKEKMLLEIMANEPVSMDKIVELSGIDVAELNGILLYMELKCLIMKMPGDLYITAVTI